MLMLDTQVYSNTGGQNSDSSTMLGGYDMNQFGTASQGKLIEKKNVAETFLAGHGSPFVAQVSMANAPSSTRRFSTASNIAAPRSSSASRPASPSTASPTTWRRPGEDGARRARHARVRLQPAEGRNLQEAFDLKGNPSIDMDWCETKFKGTDESTATPSPTGARPRRASATT